MKGETSEISMSQGDYDSIKGRMSSLKGIMFLNLFISLILSIAYLTYRYEWSVIAVFLLCNMTLSGNGFYRYLCLLADFKSQKKMQGIAVFIGKIESNSVAESFIIICLDKKRKIDISSSQNRSSLEKLKNGNKLKVEILKYSNILISASGYVSLNK